LSDLLGGCGLSLAVCRAQINFDEVRAKKESLVLHSTLFSCKPEAEFMNVQFCWGFWALRVLILEVSVYDVYITNSFKTFCSGRPGGGGGGKIR
jgi:hypothetical protein